MKKVLLLLLLAHVAWGQEGPSTGDVLKGQWEGAVIKNNA